jgi:raffinose/stachyose/melibiose transport system permease protein
MTETRRQTRKSPYPLWFFIPAAVIYGVLFLVPTVSSLWFSLTRWDLTTAEFIGLENFQQFFSEPFLVKGLLNTLIYAATTSGLKTSAACCSRFC